MSNRTLVELDALPGLTSAKRVVAALAAGSPVQSVLFYGIEGSGNAELAQILTKAWLCKNPIEGGACGECQACKAFDRGRSVDLLVVEPKGASRIIRLAAISAAEAPDEDYPISAQGFLRTAPLIAQNKVVIITEAERLNPRAANSLLKILEEPPSYGRFILLTEAVGALLPTILSRCLAVACQVPPTLDNFEPWIVALAGGAPGRAAIIATHQRPYRSLYEFGQSLPTRKSGEALILSEQFAAIAAALQAALELGARAANAEALRVLAAAYSQSAGAKAEDLQHIIEAHRRILGNANSGSTLDSLFSALTLRL